MGVVNVTPDSFSDGGRYDTLETAVAHGRRLAAEGADLLDIGGESTRPGARPVEAAEEIRRVVPVISALARELSVPLSIDTYKAEVAEAAIEAGAQMINDISAGGMDSAILRVAAAADVPIVLSHIQGTPRDMQNNPSYDDVVGDVAHSLRAAAQRAVAAGVPERAIVLDPGIGFGKNLVHNLALLNRLDVLAGLNWPVLVGTSRKRFIGTLLDDAPPEARLYGTAATVALAIARGASIVRVHDVAPMVEVARVADRVVREGEG